MPSESVVAREMARKHPKAAAEGVIAEVGIFGLIGIAHDVLDHNPGKYATFPVIQAELGVFDEVLRAAITVVDETKMTCHAATP